MNPNYIDSYSALFDVYYWSDRHHEALELIELAQQNSSSVDEIAHKIARARIVARKNGIKVFNKNSKNKTAETADLSFEQ